MATHKESVRVLSLSQLADASGRSAKTIRRLLAAAPAIEPARTDGKTLWFETPAALRRVLGPAPSDNGEVLDLAAERARLARMQADGQSMRNEELSGALLRREEVKAIWARMALSWKEKIRSVPLVALTCIPGFTKGQARILGELIDATLVEIADGTPARRSVRKHRAHKVSAS
jgi:phage terminase Nu1 subunit (DNA packaging protein)